MFDLNSLNFSFGNFEVLFMLIILNYLTNIITYLKKKRVNFNNFGLRKSLCLVLILAVWLIEQLNIADFRFNGMFIFIINFFIFCELLDILKALSKANILLPASFAANIERLERKFFSVKSDSDQE